MRRVSSLNYEKLAHDNLRTALARQELHKALKEAIKNNEHEAVILLETPAETYVEANASSIEFLINNGYNGVYISFQRPYNNICSIFSRFNIDMDKLFVIDGATAFCGQPQNNNPRCVNISSGLKIDSIIQAIYNTLIKLKCEKRFVFIDSLSTMALHEPLSEANRFPEALIKKLKDKECGDVKLIFNIAEDLTQERYVENISIYAKEYIHLGLCT